MAVSTVNISFQEDLLVKWESIFAYGESLSSKYKFTEDDVNKEIQKYRKNSNSKELFRNNAIV